ncbi:hypothetical protein Tco_0302698 [Tanacetum coccineum]
MAQPRGVSHGGQPPKTTAVVAARPIETTTAAPYGVGLMKTRRSRLLALRCQGTCPECHEDRWRDGSTTMGRPNGTSRLVVTTFTGVMLGFFLGMSFPIVLLDKKTNMHSTVPTSIDLRDIQDKYPGISTQAALNVWSSMQHNKLIQSDNYRSTKDLSIKPKYLIAFTVGYDQKENIDKAMKKDEALGLDDFEAEKYIELMKKHGLAKEKEDGAQTHILPPCAAYCLQFMFISKKLDIVNVTLPFKLLDTSLLQEKIGVVDAHP